MGVIREVVLSSSKFCSSLSSSTLRPAKYAVLLLLLFVSPLYPTRELPINAPSMIVFSLDEMVVSSAELVSIAPDMIAVLVAAVMLCSYQKKERRLDNSYETSWHRFNLKAYSAILPCPAKLRCIW